MKYLAFFSLHLLLVSCCGSRPLSALPDARMQLQNAIEAYNSENALLLHGNTHLIIAQDQEALFYEDNAFPINLRARVLIVTAHISSPSIYRYIYDYTDSPAESIHGWAKRSYRYHISQETFPVVVRNADGWRGGGSRNTTPEPTVSFTPIRGPRNAINWRLEDAESIIERIDLSKLNLTISEEKVEDIEFFIHLTGYR